MSADRLTYEVNDSGSHYGIVAGFGELFLVVVGYAMLAALLFVKYSSGLDSRWAEAFPAFVFVASACTIYLVPFSLFPVLRELWRSHYWIHLEEERVVARNLWKHATEIRYEDIVRIKREPHVPYLWAVTAGLDFLTADGRRIRLHRHIERFGECVQEIQKRCPNLVEVDYGGLDKKPAIWDATNKAM